MSTSEKIGRVILTVFASVLIYTILSSVYPNGNGKTNIALSAIIGLILFVLVTRKKSDTKDDEEEETKGVKVKNRYKRKPYFFKK